MMKAIVLLLLSIASSLVWSNQLIQPAQSISVTPGNKERLQRGAGVYMNYCAGCHSLKYLRYNQMGKDIGLLRSDGQLDEQLLKNNLITTRTATVHSPILIAMLPEDARQWFGIVPPDLSLIARTRGALWLYQYLYGFYHDPSRPFGTNNLIFPDTAMPNILEPLLGQAILMHPKMLSPPLLMREKPGEMTLEQFQNTVYDLVNFLVYVGEPARLIRYKLGGVVLSFLFVLLIVACYLKKLYWQKIH